jgi:hypothetical protein
VADRPEPEIRQEVIDFLATAPKRASGELTTEDWRRLLTYYASLLEQGLAASARRSPADRQRAALARDPRSFLQAIGIRVSPLEEVPTSELCACHGVSSSTPSRILPMRPRPEAAGSASRWSTSSPTTSSDATLASSALCTTSTTTPATWPEERVCHAFAGLILVRDRVIERILTGRPPEARQLREVFTTSSGSLEACAVRLAEYLPDNGYVVIADPSSRRIRFASPSLGASYQWGRHTPLPAHHPLWRAQTTGAYRGQARSSGRRGHG